MRIQRFILATIGELTNYFTARFPIEQLSLALFVHRSRAAFLPKFHNLTNLCYSSEQSFAVEHLSSTLGGCRARQLFSRKFSQGLVDCQPRRFDAQHHARVEQYSDRSQGQSIAPGRHQPGNWHQLLDQRQGGR